MEEIGVAVNQVSSNYDNISENFLLSGQSGDIWIDQDSFIFAKRSVMNEVNFEFTAFFPAMREPDSGSQESGQIYGLMFRRSSEPDSNFVNCFTTFQGNEIVTDFRPVPGDHAEHGNMNEILDLAQGVWLKLKRQGNVFTCSYLDSFDDNNFVALDSVTMEMPPSFDVGVFLSTNNQGPSEVTFKYPSYRLL